MSFIEIYFIFYTEISSATYLGHNKIDNANKMDSKPSISNPFVSISPIIICQDLNEINVYICPVSHIWDTEEAFTRHFYDNC